MKSIKNIALLLFSSLSFASNAQLDKIEMDTIIEGICNHNAVYLLRKEAQGQTEAKCSISKEQMEVILNKKILFLKNNSEFKSEGNIGVGVYINCEGIALGWHVVKSTCAELDQQILEVFKTFDKWTAGKLYSRAVDTGKFIGYKIEQGKIKLD